MRVLLAIAVHDYGRAAGPISYEYRSWFGPLKSLGHDVHVFDTFAPNIADSNSVGPALVSSVDDLKPDLVLLMLIEDEVPVGAINAIRERTTVANWFADDTWRFKSYSRHLAPYFDWIVTTSRPAYDAYAGMSDVRAYFSPWGYAPETFHRAEGPPLADVGFVGQRYGRRGRVVERVRDAGYTVVARGSGWPEGRLEDDALAPTFSRTKVNLNFLESSAGPFQRRGMRFRGSWRADRMLDRVFLPPRQLKARPFEITACGGFLLTNFVEELGEFFELDRELATFSSERDLLRKIDYYLEHDDERTAIAEAGYRRSAQYDWPTVLRTLLGRAM